MLTWLKLRAVKKSNKPYLIIGMAHRRPSFESVYQMVSENCDAEQLILKKSEMRKLPELLGDLPLDRFDAIWLDVAFKYMRLAADQLSRCKRLVFYEQDSLQDALPQSDWHTQFTSFYKSFSNARILTTGIFAANHLQQQGINAIASLKGYDPEHIFEEKAQHRSIDVGFIGSTNSRVYLERKMVLETLEKEGHLNILREVAYGAPYRQALNEIKVFVSADIGLHEYMAKNFEAMAAGCALVAYRQDNGEEERLGLIHGKNCLLYQNLEQAKACIAQLSSDEALRQQIATAGQQLAHDSFSFDRIAKDISFAIKPELAK